MVFNNANEIDDGNRDGSAAAYEGNPNYDNRFEVNNNDKLEISQGSQNSQTAEVQGLEDVVFGNVDSDLQRRMTLARSARSPKAGHTTVHHDQLPSIEDLKLELSAAKNPYTKKKLLANIMNLKNRCTVRVGMYLIILLSLIAIFVSVSELAGQSKAYTNAASASKQIDFDEHDSEMSAVSRFDQLITVLTLGKISKDDVLQAPNTPQRLSAQWLANDDALEMDIPRAGNSDELAAFVQRYAIASIAIALTGGANSIRRGDPNPLLSMLQFFDGKHECRWHTKFERPNNTTLRMGITCNENNEIEKLILQGMELNGNLPNEIGLLSNLKVLRLDSTNITSLIPMGMRKLTSLQHLSLTQNNFHGELKENIFGELSNLVSLELSYNNFADVLPSAISTLSNLKLLALDHNRFKGDLTKLSSLSQLEEVYVQDNRFDGRMRDSFFRDLNSLRVIDVSSNHIKGRFSSNLLAKPFIRVVNMRDNAFSGNFSAASLAGIDASATKLQFLDLGENSITGYVPDEISNLKALTHLDLSSNKLIGVLPGTMRNLINLEYLNFNENQFLEKAEIPHFLKFLTNLKELQMEKTARIGPIPNALGHLKKLKVLNLGWNGINGTIPDTFTSNATSLKFLLLNRNKLSGEFPSSQFEPLTKLKVLILDHNTMYGNVSQGVCDLKKMEVFITDCGDVEDATNERAKRQISAQSGVRCECCTRCCARHEDGCNSGDGYMTDMYERQVGDTYVRSNNAGGDYVFKKNVHFSPFV